MMVYKTFCFCHGQETGNSNSLSIERQNFKDFTRLALRRFIDLHKVTMFFALSEFTDFSKFSDSRFVYRTI